MGSAIEGCLQTGVGMYLRIPAGTIATTLFIISLQNHHVGIYSMSLEIGPSSTRKA